MIPALRSWWEKIRRSVEVKARATRACIKGQEFIIGVGIEVNHKLYWLPCPKRHDHCIHLAYLETKKQVTTQSQGFITSRNRYVLREEALAIARNAGQLLERHFHETELFSESVW